MNKRYEAILKRFDHPDRVPMYPFRNRGQSSTMTALESMPLYYLNTDDRAVLAAAECLTSKGEMHIAHAEGT